MKECSRCKETKALTEFGKDKAHKSGHKSQCRTCRNIARKGYKKESKESVRKRLFRLRYDITLEDYDRMYNEQKGRCKICNVEATSLNKALAVDHCHTTGKVRGLLCTSCNVGLGYFTDSPEKLKSALAYLHI